ncbi:MAG: porin family protein [Endomicrobia bacterium]|nr:porin family protein [Endomicrobiia bacterium]
MKKILSVFFYLIIFTSISFAENAANAAKDKVYIGAALLMSFEDFYYDDFVNNYTISTGNSKTLSGPRYDFTAGYRFSKKLRAEAEYMIISENSFETDETNSYVEYKAQALFANLVYDFWDMQEYFLTPFIGAGVGVGAPNLNISYQGVKDEVDDNGFSWQFQGGISMLLTDWLIVNVKYSYISMPDVEINSSNREEIKAEFKKGVQAVGLGIILLL